MFFDEMKITQCHELVETENGGLQYTANPINILNFFYQTPSKRTALSKEIKDDFLLAFKDDAQVALRTLFYIRDAREGNGERRIFRLCIQELASMKSTSEYLKPLIKYIPEYGRFDDLFALFDTLLEENMLSFVKSQINQDLDNYNASKPISLLAKWLPSINTSSKEAVKNAKKIAKYLGYTERNYRKTLSKLRRYLDVLEVKLSDNKWGEVDYSKVPSCANIKYSDAFLKHDEARRTAFIDKAKDGKIKMNASVLYPHQIVSKFNYYRDDEVRNNEIIALWNNLPQYESASDIMCICDTSGSMDSLGASGIKPKDVAYGLSIYFAEHAEGEFKDKVVLFSHKPQLIDLTNCKNITEKLRKLHTYNDCSNTDIQATLRLILKTAKRAKMKQSDLPKALLIISDMQFDDAVSENSVKKAVMDTISDEFKEAGYTLPKLIFWNVYQGAENQGVPMQENEQGFALIGGYSLNNLKMVLSKEIDPYKILLEVINSKRYECIKIN